MTATEYIENIRAAIKANQHTRSFYFPSDKIDRYKMNLRLAREIGFGLKDFSDYNKILGSLYSLLIISFSLDTTGVCIDNKEFLNQLLAVVHQVDALSDPYQSEALLH